MPALKKTSFEGCVTWLGQVAEDEPTIRSAPATTLDLTFDGIAGTRHAGSTRPSCVRVKDQHPEGTEIRNVRQLSVLAAEDIAAIAAVIGLDALAPELLGASIVISGIPDLTHLPPSSRLQFSGGATLTVDMENRPCQLPAREISRETPGAGKGFKAAAAGRRGVTAWVERPGAVKLGDAVVLHVPDQPVWAFLETARSGKPAKAAS